MPIFFQMLLKDTRCIWRRREVLLATFGFALLLVVVASFSFRQIGYGQKELSDLSVGIIWLAFVFCGVLGLNHTFVFERENGALSGLLQSGVGVSTVYFSKFFTNLTFILSIQFFVVFCHSILFGAEIFPFFWSLIFISFLAAIGFSALGTLLAAIATSTGGREILLPILLFPLCIPLLAGAVFVTRDLLQTGEIHFQEFWFVLICAFDVIALSLSWALFENVVKE